jgi:hypothetical protein
LRRRLRLALEPFELAAVLDLVATLNILRRNLNLDLSNGLPRLRDRA